MELSILITIILPLFGFLLLFLGGRNLSNKMAGAVATLTVAASFVLSIWIFNTVRTTGEPIHLHLFDWIQLANFKVDFALHIDQLNALWLLFVTGIGALIHWYSSSYMKGDNDYNKYFSYLNLFVFFMMMLVSGSNLLIMFIGWEGVGLCSYLLIGFWHKNNDFNNAAKKAFIMNRIGDLGFLIGAFIIISLYNTIDFVELRELTEHGTSMAALPLLGGATFAFFVAATGKSAQIPLYTWLPDAMAGPTPVSALIHAATMVTAGIYMITRMNFIFDLTPDVQNIIAVVGALTSLLAASIGLVQNDIKKVLAYSTVSQLGLMFLAIGLGAYEIAVFHVITHAFFKACLFLGSGSVIHAVGGEQDMRHMGGLKKYMGITYGTFLISSLAISGVPPFSGFFSKDEILLTAFHNNIALYIIGSLASIMTAFYMFRLMYLTFFNKFRGTEEQKSHLHESPKRMTTPLIVLAILAMVGGAISLPGNSWLNDFLAPVIVHNAASHPHELGTTEYILMIVAVVGALVGIGLAYNKYGKNNFVPGNDNQVAGLQKLLSNKYYVDEIYNTLIVAPINWFGNVFKTVFEPIIAAVVLSFGQLANELSMQGKKAQNGNIGLYLFAFVFGICAIVYYLFIR